MRYALLILMLLFSGCANGFNQSVDCLARNIYHEARGEPIAGQAMVGYATLNRVDDPRWSDNVCDVVYQPRQFSWTTDPKPIKNKEAWNESKEIARILIENHTGAEGHGVNHYLRCDVRNKVDWWRSMVFLGRIGDHCFYRG